MSDSQRRVAEQLFQRAADLPSEERPSFLDEKCGADKMLRGEVDSLLAFLENGKVASLEVADRAEEVEPDLVGKEIGPYKLTRLIGEGGFGSVYLAEQEKPIRRKVALKIIKLGMDTKQVIARFEAERQALALMDHPNIARVLDAGATGTGRPYFVMELVGGVTITRYCDERNLDLRERLLLFKKVCNAVQHAHQKGIIHRDIKPSNVLVADLEGESVPKVIDFGIAKATGKRLTELTHFTEFHQFVGTPEYMSPEQAELRGTDLDTRTDIYSLGVLLYVLLTGITPFDSGTLRRAALGEIQRIICEVDPPTPSQRISRLGDEVEKIARARRSAPQALSRTIRGDLDWIVMKALEKDRSRRYESAAGLAADINRHLACEPVLAGPPSARYKIGKFISRHRVSVLAGVIVAVTLVTALSLLTVSFVQVRSARDALKIERDAAEAARSDAEKARTGEEAQRLLAEGSSIAANREATKYAAANKFIEKMLATAHPRNAMGRAVTIRFVLDEATRMIDEGMLSEQPVVEASVRMTIGGTYEVLGLYSAAERHFSVAESIRTRLLGDDDPETLHTRSMLALTIRQRGGFKEAESLFRSTLEKQRLVLGEEHPQTMETLNGLGISLWRQDRYAEAETIHRGAWKTQCRIHGENSVEALKAMVNLGTVFWGQRRLNEAEETLGLALSKARDFLGEEHPNTLKAMNNLGLVLEAEGKYAKAEDIYRRTVELDMRVLGKDHPGTQIPKSNLKRMLIVQKKTEELRPLLAEEIAEKKEKADRPEATVAELNEYAWRLLTCEIKDLRDADAALAVIKRATGKKGGDDAHVLDTLAVAYHDTGDLVRALETERIAVRAEASIDTSMQPSLEMNLIGFLLEKEHPRYLERTDLKEISPGLKKMKFKDTRRGATLAAVSRNLIEKGLFPEAETILVECLGIRRSFLSEDHWLTAEVRCLLGGALAAQKRYYEAEPLLLSVYSGLSSESSKAALSVRRETLERIIALYEAWGMKEKAAEWRSKLSEIAWRSVEKSTQQQAVIEMRAILEKRDVPALPIQSSRRVVGWRTARNSTGRPGRSVTVICRSINPSARTMKETEPRGSLSYRCRPLTARSGWILRPSQVIV
jgi:eukaryotic-like serine/threonine-protein kinase